MSESFTFDNSNNPETQPKLEQVPEEPVLENLNSESPERNALEQESVSEQKEPEELSAEKSEVQAIEEGLKKIKEVTGFKELSNKIEQALEQDSIEEKKKEPKKLVKFWQSLFKGLILGTVLGLGSPSENEQNYESHREMQKQEIIQETGIDLYDIGSKESFEVRNEVKNGNGEYIIFIGQIHDRHEILTKLDNSKKIIRSQKSIEQIINKIAESKSTKLNIFAEGYDDKGPEIMLESKNGLEKFKKTKPQNFDLEYFTDVIYLDAVNVEDDLLGIKFAEAYKEKGKEIIDYYSKNTPRFKSNDEKQKFETLLIKLKERLNKKYNLNINNAIFGKDEVYSYGAVDKLFFEGKIAVKATETEEANDLANDELKILDELKEKLKKKQISQEEYDKSRKEHKAKFTHLAMEVREQIAIEKIAQDHSSRIHVLVYGDLHSFNTEKWNQEHPDHKLGLISLHDIHNNDLRNIQDKN